VPAATSEREPNDRHGMQSPIFQSPLSKSEETMTQIRLSPLPTEGFEKTDDSPGLTMGSEQRQDYLVHGINRWFQNISSNI